MYKKQQDDRSSPENEKIWKKRAHMRLCAIASTVPLVFCFGFGATFTRDAALVGAGLQLPQGFSTLFPKKEEKFGSLRTRVEAGVIAASERFGTTQSQEKSFDLRETPTDILLLMEEAKLEFRNQTRDGDIQKKTYTFKDGTQNWGETLSVRNTTETQKSRDLSKDLEKPLPLQVDPTKPAVLIFHTHTTEAYEIIDRNWYAAEWSSRTEQPERSIVRVGDAMTEMLERAGFQVIHDKEIYDRTYTGAYDKSRVAVQKYLQKFPSIQVTLDLHRDAIHADQGVRIRPVSEINGKNAAQIMIITGINEGAITTFPNWETNLSFATKLHFFAETAYPGLMRPIFFCPRLYNMNETPFSLLLEFGADVNTLDEAVYSGRMMGETLGNLLKEYSILEK